MKKVLSILLLCFCFAVQAQNIKFMSMDSVPIENVIISDLAHDESVYTNAKGEVNVSIFEDDQILQVNHVGFEKIVLAKSDLVYQKQIFLFETDGTNLDAVEIPIDLRTRESKYELITQSTSITRQKIEQQAPATSADMLENTGQVLIQKSQLGGGSPILRGFEASRVLLVVDGVRMNNAIYRGGHLQNAITVDPAMLAGTEIIFGPNSLIYGSDAMGGVIHFKTKGPQLRVDSNSVNKFGGFLRYQSASNAMMGNFHFNFANEKWGVYAGLTQSEFGDLRMGENRTHGYTDFGKIPFYVDQINGSDSILSNSDQNIHKNSGYSQQDAYSKILYQPKEGYRFILNTQMSTSSNVPRFDKLNEYSNNELRYGDWYYGPQNRFLTSLSSEINEKTRLFDHNTTILAYQQVEESRHSRDFGSSMLENQLEKVHVYSLNSDFLKYVDSAKTIKINYGIEGLRNEVQSSANVSDINNVNASNFLETRYPGGGAIYHSIAAYLAAHKKLGKHLIKGGARYSTSMINARFDTNQVVNLLKLRDVRLASQSVTSSLGYVYHTGNFKLYSSVSTAFKAPNVDDFAKIFEKKGNLTIPNVELKPETSISGEIGSSYEGVKFEYDIAVFYTRVFDIMVKDSLSIGGQTSLLIEGENLNLVGNVNNGTADIYGAFAAIKWNIANGLSLSSTATLTRAKFVENDEPVPHIPPFYGRTSLDYLKGKFKFSFYSKYNGLKKWDESSFLTDNPDEGIENVGTPSWYTLNLSAFVYPYDNLRIQMAVENIADVHYKPFASGISGAGRNFMASAYFSF